ncbi:MAG TPA: ABC transporter permease subunit, partial [Candidatus Binatia bacterium]|nr:ABC transporter permease subunit [Candidatus Binatia bacterium]
MVFSRATRLFSRELTVPVVTSVVVLAAWEALVHAGFLRAAFFPPPTNIVSTLLGLAVGGELWLHAGMTLGRLIASFLMALIPGTALGLAMGWWMGMRFAADPLIRLLFPIPSIAFFPVVIFYLGLSEWGLLLTAAITPFLLIAVQSASAVESLERPLLEAGRNYGASGRRLFLRVILPAALPRLFIGYRLALGVGFIVTVAVEMVAAKHGLGGFLWHSWQILRIEEMY